MSIDGFFKRQPKGLIALEALLILILIGALDYSTGWELSVSLLYASNILLVAWHVSRSLGLAFAVVSATVWCWANGEVHPYVTHWGYAWATTSRLAYFVFVAIGGATLKARRASDRARIEALERARDLEREIARISEHEQRRIGQDLHDGVCQMLAAIQCALSSVRDDLNAKKLPEAAATDEVVGMLKGAIKETRDLARNLFPIQMAEAGLPAMLDEMAARSKRSYQIQASFETQGDVRTNDPEVAMHLYRIAQEALNNAVKHGGAKKVVVALRVEDHMLKLTISDDGTGLPVPKTSDRGMGLKTMRYRALQIGAQLDIKNNATQGVTVTCSVRMNDAVPTPPTGSNEDG